MCRLRVFPGIACFWWGVTVRNPQIRRDARNDSADPRRKCRTGIRPRKPQMALIAFNHLSPPPVHSDTALSPQYLPRTSACCKTCVRTVTLGLDIDGVGPIRGTHGGQPQLRRQRRSRRYAPGRCTRCYCAPLHSCRNRNRNRCGVR